MQENKNTAQNADARRALIFEFLRRDHNWDLLAYICGG